MPKKALVIVSGVPLPKIVGRGRKKGSGSNMDLLQKMDHGDTIWGLNYDRMQSIRSSAFKCGVKIAIRFVKETKDYVLKKK